MLFEVSLMHESLSITSPNPHYNKQFSEDIVKLVVYFLVTQCVHFPLTQFIQFEEH